MGASRRTTRVVAVFALLIAALVGVCGASLCLGSVPIAPADLWAVLSGADAGGTAAQVVWSIRLPRMLAALVLGGALALAGILLQTFFNNPIAGPYVLGISSGSKFAVALMMVGVAGRMGVVASWMAVAAATAGALVVMLCVLLFSRRIRTASGLIVAGVMLGYLCNAATDFVVTFASDASIVNLRNWSMGSFSGTNWNDVRIMVVVVVLAGAWVLLLAKPLGAYQLGEGYAQSVGVNVRAFRVKIILLSSVLSACVTAFAGPISFVGIAVPHVIKRLLGTSRSLVVIPAAFLGGSVFCLVSDLIARTVLAPTEMAVSTITAALGVPVVIWMLLERQRPARFAEATGETDSFAHGVVTSEKPLCDMRAPEGPALTTMGLSVGYDGNALVRTIDLEVRAGQVVALIGPNGAGKSTMLKTFAGQLRPLEGAVLLGEKRLGELSELERARRCSVLLTERPRTELLTCFDVVGMGRYPYTGRLGVLTEADVHKVYDALALMEVADLAETDFMRLSDGQRQRVLLARALCQEPQVLVLDEPTSYLDIRYQVGLLNTLRTLAAERGLAVVMTLHELSLARQASDWLVCVKDGSIVAQGTPKQVFVDAIVKRLFDLEDGMFDAESGTVLLADEEGSVRAET